MIELIKPSRRGFLAGLFTASAAVAMPAIIRLAPIMPVKIIPATTEDLEKLGHVEKEVQWWRTSKSATKGWATMSNGKKFSVETEIILPSKANEKNIDLIDRLLTRFADQGLLKEGDGFSRLVTPKSWFDEEYNLKG